MPAEADFLNGMTPEQAARALVDGRLALDFGGPPKTIGERVARNLYVAALNRELDRIGSPIRIEIRPTKGGSDAR